MVRKFGLCLGSTVAAMLATAVWAQIPQAGAPAAAVPKQIASAKKVFISNMGTDSMSAAAFRYERAENRPYNEFYAAVKAWGRYQLVDSPADADLIYEIGFTAPITHNGEPTVHDPQLNLSIVDPRTHFRLWTLLAPVNGGLRPVRWDKNLADAMKSLMEDLKKLSVRAAALPTEGGNQWRMPAREVSSNVIALHCG